MDQYKAPHGNIVVDEQKMHQPRQHERLNKTLQQYEAVLFMISLDGDCYVALHRHMGLYLVIFQ